MIYWPIRRKSDMLTREQAEAFAHEWIEVWNSHDLDRIMAHYTEDFEMTSPKIVQYIGNPSGTLKGKENVRAYWKIGLERNPNLYFELIHIMVSVDSVTIYYKNHEAKFVAEVIYLNADGKGIKGTAHYTA
jgi:ketosteroid isomerase-like protein